ncbi:MAG: ATP-binding protein [Spirochaetes bacterium]|nr:ATP-binding protein [Spirochaetota bacterium]MBU0954537.1 ATP-binding protein [Spirochaetota bacterium]
MSTLQFQGKNLTSLKMKIPVDGNFGKVLKTFNELGYPAAPVDAERINFAVLELVSNSLRAHREKNIADPVLVELNCTPDSLHITIRDSGRGFDPSVLPYNIDEDVNNIDLMSSRFAAYREQYQNSRFGMGFIATRRIFPHFKLYFIDTGLQPCEWPDQNLHGTVVELALPFNPGLAEEPDAMEELTGQEAEAS